MTSEGSSDSSPQQVDRNPSDPHAHSQSAAARNAVSLLASRLVVALLGWSGTVLIAHILSPTDWGVFSFVFGLLSMMSIVTDLGVGRVVLAKLLDADADEAEVVASSFIALRAALGLLGYLVALGYVLVMGYDGDVIRATALAGLCVIIATPAHALMTLYQSRLKLTVVAMAESVAQFVQLLLTVLAAVTYPTLLIFILPAIANQLVGGAWKLYGVRRGWVGVRITRRPELWRWREMLRDAATLSLGMAMITLLSGINILMLGKMDNFDSVGLYSVANKFPDVLGYVAPAIVTPTATLLVAAWPLYPDRFRDRMRSAAVGITAVAALAVTGMWASAEQIIGLLYGSRFAVAADACRMLLVGAVFAAISQLILAAFVSAGKQRSYPWVALGALIVNSGLNFLLIPRFSYTGAAAATLTTQLAMVIAMSVLLSRTLPIARLLPIGRVLLVAALSATVCGLTSLLSSFGTPWIVVAGAAGLLYCGGAWILKLFPPDIASRFIRKQNRQRSGT